jgi:hypothetical protein
MGDRRTGTGTLGRLAAALAVNLAFDGLGWLIPWTTPPHLLLRYAPEFVREMLSPAVVSPSASLVLSLIDLLLLGVVPPGTPRRTAVLAAWLFGFWLLAEGLLGLVWLSAPAGTLLAGLAAGAVRSGVAAWTLLRLSEGAVGPVPAMDSRPAAADGSRSPGSRKD